MSEDHLVRITDVLTEDSLLCTIVFRCFSLYFSTLLQFHFTRIEEVANWCEINQVNLCTYDVPIEEIRDHENDGSCPTSYPARYAKR